jgi:hypothetical protein
LLARAGITRANSINQLDLEPVAGEHYCDKWLRLGNLSPPGFDAPSLAENPSGTRLFVSQSETLECHNWLQNLGLDTAAPLLCIQAGSRHSPAGATPASSNLLINPAPKYAVFSQRVSVRSKASERRFSHSKASSDNVAAGRHALA